MDEYRFRAQQAQAQRTEAPINSLVSPPRNGGARPLQSAAQDPRNTLPRRFTTDAGRVPTLGSLSSQRMPDSQEYPTAVSLAPIAESSSLGRLKPH